MNEELNTQKQQKRRFNFLHYTGFIFMVIFLIGTYRDISSGGNTINLLNIIFLVIGLALLGFAYKVQKRKDLKYKKDSKYGIDKIVKILIYIIAGVLIVLPIIVLLVAPDLIEGEFAGLGFIVVCGIGVVFLIIGMFL